MATVGQVRKAMRTWIWPLSWYFRIRQLEARVRMLEAEKRQLSEQLRAVAIRDTVLSSAYIAAIATITSALGDRS